MKWFLTTCADCKKARYHQDPDDTDYGIGIDNVFDESELVDRICDLEKKLLEDYQSKGPVGSEVHFDPKENRVELERIGVSWDQSHLALRFRTEKHYETGMSGGYYECWAYPVLGTKAEELSAKLGID